MKIKEDLELQPTEIDYPEEMFDNYLFRTSDDFVIVDDVDGLMEFLGFEEYSDLSDYLDDRYGYDQWGDSESWTNCSYCGKAIYLDDYYSRDYWIEPQGSGIFCSDCVRNETGVRDDYIKSLINDSEKCNEFLSEQDLEDFGLVKLEDEYESGYYGRNNNPHIILDTLLSKYPNGKFIFDSNSRNRYNIVYTVWAFPGYEEGAIEDEEE